MWRDRGNLLDIEKSCERIIEKTKGRSFEEFIESEDVHDIIALHIAVIGEAARKLSEETKQKLDIIPWHKVIGMRNRIVHEYNLIDHNEVWKAVTIHIPELYQVVKSELGAP